MEEKMCTIALNSILSIGGKRFANLIKRFGSAQSIIKAKESDLCQVAGIGKKTAKHIKMLQYNQIAAKEIEKSKKLGVQIVTQGDPLYPAALLNIHYPPPVIYILGELIASDMFSIAVIGSRKPNYYGKKTAKILSKAAVKKGFAVISGMARGIDSYAHEGALVGRGRTIAVLGSGIDVIYPPENQRLAEKIKENGAIISEFPFGTCPFANNFPRRNRIISGLALGVLVVQAKETSGALITADFALEQGKEVFAVPGEIGNTLSRGTHKLIRQGARLVEGINDILDEFGIPVMKESILEKEDKNMELSSPERRILAQLGFSAVSTDDIVSATGFSPPQVTATLVSLELKDVAIRVKGGYVKA